LLDQNASEDHWQWEAFIDKTQTLFMLNTDFEILFDLDLDASGKSLCNIDVNCIKSNSCNSGKTCPLVDSTYQVAKLYKEVGQLSLG